ncbi:MAG: hypothetical protein IPJ78_16695 [Gemmatimonadetes bacterium]|nr:hypothetical protein [Gemmatimonadota bacterium]
MRSLVLTLAFSSACALGSINSSHAGGDAPQSFRLVRVGGRDLESRAANSRSCSLRPFWGRFTLDSASWSSVDSLFINCVSSDRSAELRGREGSGHYVRKGGDTLDFYVSDTTEGVHGYVFSGILHRGSLRLLAADEEPGDYLYRRVDVR